MSKAQAISLVSSFILFSSSVSFAGIEFGSHKSAGTGCFGASGLVKVIEDQGRYALPLRVRANKKSEVAFERKACTFRVPIKVAPNQKLQLSDVSQVVRVVTETGAEVKTSLNIGFVGRASAPLNSELKLSADDSSAIENVKSDGLVSESECGKDAILSGNLNTLVNGAGSQAFVSTGVTMVTLKLVNCQ